MFPSIIVHHDVPTRMRDGTILRADLYHPDSGGPFPALLTRTPYDKLHAQDQVYAHPAWYARHGYLVVAQDTRGCWASDGELYPFLNEMTDGYDTVEWVASLPQCNGKVGMYGFSYVGATQLLAALLRPPHLTCCVPGMTGAQYYDGWAYQGGAFAWAMNLHWALKLAIGEAHHRGRGDLERATMDAWLNMRAGYGYLPLNEVPPLKQSGLANYFFDWLAHPSHDDYWKRWDIAGRYAQINVPALHIAGWYDVFREGTLANFNGLRREGANERARQNQRLVAGPWYHVPWTPLTGNRDFGPAAANPIDELHLRWFDAWLKGDEARLQEQAPVRLFVMGLERWRDEEQWPPKGARDVEFFLHSQGTANSLYGDGRLERATPGQEQPDIYVYDPRYPVASLGGHSLGIPGIAPMGPADQRPVEVNKSLLVYTSAPLQQPLWVAGPVTVELHAASSAVDTDWTVKLVDVFPDGRAINLTEGILRARFRDSLEWPALLTPGQVYRFVIQAGNTCNVFQSGHCIRLEISSSNFPHWDRNPNTGHAPGTDGFGDLVVATQVVFHDGERPSRLVLPVVE